MEGLDWLTVVCLRCCGGEYPLRGVLAMVPMIFDSDDFFAFGVGLTDF